MIKKINQILIEKYPNLWNSKLFWVVLSSIPFHFIYFIIGYFFYSSEKSLQRYGRDFSDFFGSVPFILGVIVSILILVYWLLQMFKNNGFKNFYPTNRKQLFLQFFYSLVIIFSVISFPISSALGMKVFIYQKYPDEQIENDKKIINKVAVFLTQEPQHYTLDNLSYLPNVKSLQCEHRQEDILPSKPHYKFKEFYYQFFTTYNKVVKTNQYIQDSYSNVMKFLPEPEKTLNTPIHQYFYDENRKEIIFTFKKNFIQLPEKYLSLYSYRSYSEIFYDNLNSYTRSIINREVNELLDKKNPDEIKKLMEDFLQISNRYKISHNLTAEKWLKLVYFPEKFEIKNAIKKTPYQTTRDFVYEHTTTVISEDFAGDFKHFLTPYYFCSDEFKYLLTNIHNIKENEISPMFLIIAWLSLIFSLFIFTFRVTGLKPLIFGGILSGILILSISIFSISILGLLGFDYGSYKFLTFATYLIILTLSFLKTEKKSRILNKFSQGIFITLSLIFFPLALFNLCEIINYIYNQPAFKDEPLFDTYSLTSISVYFILVLIFIFLYIPNIRKWRAKEEQN